MDRVGEARGHLTCADQPAAYVGGHTPADVAVCGEGRPWATRRGDEGRRSDRFVLGLQQVCERLEALPWAVQELAAREGRGLDHAVAEHVLACYRSRDSNFPLELAREGVVEAEGEAVWEVVQSTVAEVAASFMREPQPPPSSGSSNEDSSPPPEPTDLD